MGDQNAVLPAEGEKGLRLATCGEYMQPRAAQGPERGHKKVATSGA
jgi:hypothetical protein